MPADATIPRPGISDSDPSARRPLARSFIASALAAACLLAAIQGAGAQQTVIIGGGPAIGPAVGPTYDLGAAGTIGGDGGGVFVNDTVLDSLGPGSSAAGVPLAAPQTPVYGSRIATSGAPSGTGAYRLPETGELVVTRPATLLHPPIEPPRSRLALPRPSGAATAKAAKRAGTAAAAKLPSRLIATPPKPSPAMVVKTPKAAPAPARPAVTAGAPELPKIPKATARADTAKPAAEVAVAVPRVPAPPPPSLVEGMLDKAAPKVAAPAAPSVPAAPSAPAASTEVAAIPPAKVQDAARETGVTAAPPDGDLRLTFAAGSAELSEAVKRQLGDLAQSLSLNPARRLQLLAFAADAGEGASRARRLSLSRALAVRAFLIDRGVRSTRMDVRALGSKTGDGPADRVDVLSK